MSMMSHTRRFTVAGALLASLVLSHDHASAQNRDSLLNGAAIGGAIGAGIGIAFTHAVRDSDLTAGQYGYGALVFGAIGAGAGLGVDALFNRSPRPAATRSGLFVAPAVGRVNGVAVIWRWGENREVRRTRVHTEARRHGDARRAFGWKRDVQKPCVSVTPCLRVKSVTSVTSVSPAIDVSR